MPKPKSKPNQQSKDPRHGLPSASDADRLEACPGSFWLAKGQERKSTVDSTLGERVHAALEKGDGDGLNSDEYKLYDLCTKSLLQVIDGLFGDTKIDTHRVWKEERLWDTQGRYSEESIFSGMPDFVMRSGNRWLIADYKTGRGEVSPAHLNGQLRWLAVLVAAKHYIKTIPTTAEFHVATIQPYAETGDKISITKYTRADVELAKEAIYGLLKYIGTLKDIPHEDLPLHPGDKVCKYCPAKAVCPAIKKELSLAENLKANPEKLKELSGEDAANLLARLKLLEDFTETIRSNAKRIIEAGSDVPGWKVVPGQMRSTISDPVQVYNSISQAESKYKPDPDTLNMSPAEFVEYCTLSKSKAKAILKQVTKLKGKELDAAMEEYIDPHCTFTRGSNRLIKDTGIS